MAGATFASLLDAAKQAAATAPDVGNSSQLLSVTNHAQTHSAEHQGRAHASAPEQTKWYAALYNGRMQIPPKSAKAILPQRWSLGMKPPEYLTAIPDGQPVSKATSVHAACAVLMRTFDQPARTCVGWCIGDEDVVHYVTGTVRPVPSEV